MRCSHLVKSTAAVAMFGVAVCSDSGPNNRPITLSFSSQPPAAVTPADRAPDYDITVTIGSNTLVVTKAQLVIRKMELKQSTATTCPDDDASHADCNEVKLGPMLVDLPLTATASTAITAAVPQGTYNQVEFQIHRPTIARFRLAAKSVASIRPRASWPDQICERPGQKLSNPIHSRLGTRRLLPARRC